MEEDKKIISVNRKVAFIVSDTLTALKENFEITENIYEIPNSVDIKKIKVLSEEKVKLPQRPLFTTLGYITAGILVISLFKGKCK